MSSTHIMRICSETNDNTTLNKSHNFWNVESIEIKDNESSSVYDQFRKDITLKVLNFAIFAIFDHICEILYPRKVSKPQNREIRYPRS